VGSGVSGKAAAPLWQDRHILAAYGLQALVAIHVAAALYHRFIQRDEVMARMVGQLRSSVRGSTAGASEGPSAPRVS